MASYTERFTETMIPLVVAHPDSVAPGTITSDRVDAGYYHRMFLYVDVGDIVATGTVDIKLTQATTAAGAGVKDITGKAITQLTQAGGDSDSIVGIELRAEELDVNNGFNWVGVVIVVGTAAAELSAVLMKIIPRYEPPATTGWQEIVD